MTPPIKTGKPLLWQQFEELLSTCRRYCGKRMSLMVVQDLLNITSTNLMYSVLALYLYSAQ
jgi:hypothetical protein